MTNDNRPPEGRLLLQPEVAALFRVGPETVARWVTQGKLAEIRTPGGRPRYRENEIRALLQPEPQQ